MGEQTLFISFRHSAFCSHDEHHGKRFRLYVNTETCLFQTELPKVYEKLAPRISPFFFLPLVFLFCMTYPSTIDITESWLGAFSLPWCSHQHTDIHFILKAQTKHVACKYEHKSFRLCFISFQLHMMGTGTYYRTYLC